MIGVPATAMVAPTENGWHVGPPPAGSGSEASTGPPRRPPLPLPQLALFGTLSPMQRQAEAHATSTRSPTARGFVASQISRSTSPAAATARRSTGSARQSPHTK
eukprot:SAG11_NODE_4940_length_1716_cov_2.717378_1_plen_103_part_10